MPSKKIAKNNVNLENSNSLLYNVPNEILIEIFQFLEREDLDKIKLVCKKFNELRHAPKLQRIFLKYSLKNTDLQGTVREQYIRLKNEITDIIVSEPLQSSNSAVNQAEIVPIDQCIEIIIANAERSEKEQLARNTLTYFKKLNKNEQEVISSSKKIKRITPRSQLAAVILGILLIGSGGWFGLKEHDKDNFNKAASDVIDVIFPINVSLFIIAVLAAVINNYYQNKLENTQDQIKKLDEQSPLLPQRSANTEASSINAIKP